MPRSHIRHLAIISLTAAPLLQAATLPDTGQSVCDNGSNVLESCSNTNTGDAATMPRQDGRFGRDPATVAGVVTSSGAAGLDYSKVCNSGELAGSGSCPADPALGGGDNEWGCTQDNLTGLVWEVKTNDSGLRDKDWAYTWYSSDSATNGGSSGTADTGTGVGTDHCFDGAHCDTETFVTAVNSGGLCGQSDWRMPSKRELGTIIHFGLAEPAIDVTYFPNNISLFHWTSSTYVNTPTSAWCIDVRYGSEVIGDKATSTRYVRLVRGTRF